MQLLGHKNIKNTPGHNHLVNFKEENSDISKIAANVQKACKLIEAGFEHVTGEYSDGGKIFRKMPWRRG